MEEEFTEIKEAIAAQKIKDHTCGFCGRREDEVPYVIAGPVTCICSQCVELSVECIRDHDPEFCKNT